MYLCEVFIWLSEKSSFKQKTFTRVGPNRVCQIAWVAWQPWVTRLRVLRGSSFYASCVGYVGQNICYLGQNFTCVAIFTWVVWVKYIFVWISISCVGQFFLRGSRFSPWVKIFCGVLDICVGQFRGGKKSWIGTFTLTS